MGTIPKWTDEVVRSAADMYIEGAGSRDCGAAFNVSGQRFATVMTRFIRSSSNIKRYGEVEQTDAGVYACGTLRERLVVARRRTSA